MSPLVGPVIRFLSIFLLILAQSGLAQTYRIDTFAGGGQLPIGAQVIVIPRPARIVVDSSGNSYLALSESNQVWVVNSAGMLVRVIGTGVGGYSGDGGSAASAQLFGPRGLVLDSSGNLYIADTLNNRIRKVTPGNVISTIAGSGAAEYNGNSQPSATVNLSLPVSLTIDSTGTLYISDTGRVRKLSAGLVTVIAGNGTSGYEGENKSATATPVYPYDIAVDRAGAVYVADYTNRIRKISGGIVWTVAGTGDSAYNGDNMAATSTNVAPSAMTFDSSGDLYFAEIQNNRVRKMSGGIVLPVAGTGSAGFGGDGATATSALLQSPGTLAFDAGGTLYIGETYRVRKIISGVISTFLGNGAGTTSDLDNIPVAYATLNPDAGLATDGAGEVYFVDRAHCRVRKIAAGMVSTIAGDGTCGYNHDGISAINAQLNNPMGVAAHGGALFIADSANHRIRMVQNGIMTTVAGSGTAAYSGDGGSAVVASLNQPKSVAFSANGDMYINDGTNNRIRKVSGGIISTVAGSGEYNFLGDGPALSTGFSPVSIAVSPNGEVYIIDGYSWQILKVSNGTVAALPGTRYSYANDLAVDDTGNVYFTDSGWKVNRYSGGTEMTIAGTGNPGFSGDGGVATAAELGNPLGIAWDPSGTIYFADSGRIRILTPSGGGGTLTVVSATSGAGLSGTLQFVITDTGGYAGVNAVEAIINTSATTAYGCYLRYLSSSRTLELRSDDGTRFSTPFVIGQSGTLANGQCVIDTAAVTASGDGSTLTLTVPIVFEPSFFGSKNVYLWASNAAWATGYQRLGAWNVPKVNGTPSVKTVSPSRMANRSAVNLSVIVSDTLGAYNLSDIEIVVSGGGPTDPQSCHLRWERQFSRLWLQNDAGTGYLGPVTPRTVGLLSNRQCVVDASSAFFESGQALDIDAFVTVAFNQSFTGDKQIYVWADNSTGQDTGYVLGATWNVPVISPVPKLVSMESGSGSQGTLRFKVTHDGGTDKIAAVEVLINSSFSVPNSCYFRLDFVTNTLAIVNDAGTAFGGATGTPAAISNSQCSVVAGQITKAYEDDNLLLLVPITFSQRFGGTKSIYLWASSVTGENTGYQPMATWTVPAGVQSTPAPVSATSGSGASGTLQFVFSSTVTYTELSLVEVLINIPFSGVSACYMRYDRRSNALYLMNDGGSQFGSAATPGSGAALSNSQCSIDVALTAVTTSGNTLTLSVPIAFSSSFGGSRGIYLWASNQNGLTSGYRQMGTWTVPGTTSAPTLESASSGSGGSGTLEFSFSHPAGNTNVSVIEMIINSPFSAANACYLRYERSGNRLFLVNDAGNQFTGPATPGGSGTLSNSQCSVPASSVMVAASGNMLWLSARITFTNGFVGSRAVYLWAANGTGQNTGYQEMGTWIVTGSTPAAPVLVSASSGSGGSGTLQFVISHPNGTASLSAMEMVINSPFSGANACYLRYEKSASRLYLVNDAGNQFTGPVTPGGSGALSNSQCSVNASGVTVSSAGDTLTLSVPITYAGGFAGSRAIYLWAASSSGQNTGYQQMGTWIVTGSTPAAPVLVSASSGSGGSGTLQFVFSHPNGTASLSAMEMVINSPFSGANACYLRYEKGANRLYLVNDAGNQFTGPVTPGGSGALSNSQCSVDASGVTVSPAGDTLTLSVPITYAGGFAGSRAIYLWASSIGGQATGYQQLGTWTVSGGVNPPILVSASSGDGSAGTLQFVFANDAGYSNLAAVEVILAESVSAANACYLRYEPGANRLYLVNDAGNHFAGPVTPGSNGTLSNSQCEMDAVGVTAVGSGGTLTLSVPLKFTGTFAGRKSIFMWAQSRGGSIAGYTEKGTWTTTGTQSGIPTTVSANSGSGSNGVIQAVFSDSAGPTDIDAMEVVINSTLSAANACYVRYNRGANTMSLVNDAGTQFGTASALGAGTTLSNSQCTVNLTAATATVSAYNLTLTFPVTFANTFSGTKGIYLWVITRGSTIGGYDQRGAWVVP